MIRAVPNPPVESVFRFSVPTKTVSGANSREHWAAKAKRVKAERASTGLAVLVAGAKTALRVYGPEAGRIIVTLTRLSPRFLDPGDNLPASMKAVRDQLAAMMGIDDRDMRCCWVYGQTKSKKLHAVEVEIRMGP